MNNILLEIKELKKYYSTKNNFFSLNKVNVFAVDNISFKLYSGETLGIVGESGCGKTTTGKTILKLIEPTSGQIIFNGIDITNYNKYQFRPIRKEMQIIFQDPYSSLNPRLTAHDIISEPLIVHKMLDGKNKHDRIESLIKQVGLTSDDMNKYPHEFSGGQRQRIGIARALTTNPKLIITDEPVSALDSSIKAQVINLLMDLQNKLNISYLFISHDLSVVYHISHRIAVMYLGKIVEIANRKTLFTNPLHPYTEALLSAVPIPNPNIKRKNKILLKGDVPSPTNPPNGCHFHTRCPRVMKACYSDKPSLNEVTKDHFVACHLH